MVESDCFSAISMWRIWQGATSLGLLLAGGCGGAGGQLSTCVRSLHRSQRADWLRQEAHRLQGGFHFENKPATVGQKKMATGSSQVCSHRSELCLSGLLSTKGLSSSDNECLSLSTMTCFCAGCPGDVGETQRAALPPNAAAPRRA